VELFCGNLRCKRRKKKKTCRRTFLSSVAKQKRETACWVALLASNKICAPA